MGTQAASFTLVAGQRTFVPVRVAPFMYQTITRPLVELRQIRSGLPSPLKSPAAIGTQSVMGFATVTAWAVLLPLRLA